MSWGPPPAGYAAPPGGPARAGSWLLAVPILIAAIAVVLGGFGVILAAVFAAAHDTAVLGVLGTAVAALLLLAVLASTGVGFAGGRVATGWSYRRPGVAICWGLLTAVLLVAYSVGYAAGTRLPHRRRPVPPVLVRRVSEQVIAAADPLTALVRQVEVETGRLPATGEVPRPRCKTATHASSHLRSSEVANLQSPELRLIVLESAPGLRARTTELPDSQTSDSRKSRGTGLRKS